MATTGLRATSAGKTPATHSLGTIVRSGSGTTGVVSVIFADSVWVKQFLSCPRCDRDTMWSVHTGEADLSPDAGPQYLIVDSRGLWHIVDAAGCAVA